MRSFICDKTDITDNDFDDVSDLILNKSILIINDCKYRICEIEFYLRNEGHDDQYTHTNPDQQLYGKFYFHKYKNGTYKSGTYKGLDITLGNKKSHCGILIRSCYDIKNKEFIEGPCKSVNEILKQYDCNTINEFTNNKILDVLNNSRHFIIDDYKSKKETIYHGSRIGLSDKYPEYRNKPYRYVIMKDKIKKQKRDLIKVE
jgi:3-methyladenine DNA glycosylase Mpg